MAILIRGVTYDTMKEACVRLDLSRATILRYLEDGFFTPPPRHSRGRGKRDRYFTDEWYAVNEAKLRQARGN